MLRFVAVPKIDLLYINDLPLNSLLNDFLFADDTTLLASGPPELIEFVNVEFHRFVCILGKIS